VREKIAEIIETLEKADQLFNQLQGIGKETMALWQSGIEKLAGAIWLYERGGVNATEPEITPEV
jgi:hypothetical protein